jgi:hypothetical protein
MKDIRTRGGYRTGLPSGGRIASFSGGGDGRDRYGESQVVESGNIKLI